MDCSLNIRTSRDDDKRSVFMYSLCLILNKTSLGLKINGLGMGLRFLFYILKIQIGIEGDYFFVPLYLTRLYI